MAHKHRHNHRAGKKHHGHVHRIVRAVKNAFGMDKPSRQVRREVARIAEWEARRSPNGRFTGETRHERRKDAMRAARHGWSERHAG